MMHYISSQNIISLCGFCVTHVTPMIYEYMIGSV